MTVMMKRTIYSGNFERVILSKHNEVVQADIHEIYLDGDNIKIHIHFNSFYKIFNIEILEREPT